jgi:hypothetical protein
LAKILQYKKFINLVINKNNYIVIIRKLILKLLWKNIRNLGVNLGYVRCLIEFYDLYMVNSIINNNMFNNMFNLYLYMIKLNK